MRVRRTPATGIHAGDAVGRLVQHLRRHRVAFWLAVALGPFVIGYLFAALALFPAPIFATARVVPRVLELPLEAAQEVLAKARLDAGEIESVNHPTAPRGAVVWQDPPPGVAVPEGTGVQLAVSSGPQRVPIPDLTGYDVGLAHHLITAAGLRVDRVDSTQAPVPKGVVVNTRPPAGTALTPGSQITLVVSVGAPTITVPNLIGLTRQQAQAMLEEAGLTLGTSLFRTSSTGVPGAIIGQNPAPNTLSAPGTAVDVIVARRRSR